MRQREKGDWRLGGKRGEGGKIVEAGKRTRGRKTGWWRMLGDTWWKLGEKVRRREKSDSKQGKKLRPRKDDYKN